jgi:hypothetical protein
MKMTRVASLRRSFPTFQLIAAPFRWIGRSRRRILVAWLMVLAMIAAPPLWWVTQLWGLPDIGDPFDVAAFRAFTIPDDRNAFVLYRQAAAVLKPDSDFEKRTTSQANRLARWSKTTPELRRWVEENREALALYRQGAERPDALDLGIGSNQEGWKTFQALRFFHMLVLLEASRLEEQGDMAGAWGWYRAMLRTLHHVGMHGTAIRRLVAQHWQEELLARSKGWAADPRTTPSMLRQALEDVVECEALAPSETDTLKIEYLNMDRWLDDPNNPGRTVPMMTLRRLWSYPDYQLDPEQLQALWDAWRFWRREPERSRRVIRLVTANWLAYYERPPGNRPKPDPDPSRNFDFYPFGPEAPAKARVLSPQALDRWLETTHDAQVMFGMLELIRVRSDEWANHRELLILLGTQLYRRDHATDPPAPEALVGPYLKRLPGEFPDDLRNEAIPRDRKTVD